MVDRVLASPAMKQALERVLAGPEVRAALKSQTAGLADEVMGGVREPRPVSTLGCPCARAAERCLSRRSSRAWPAAASRSSSTRSRSSPGRRCIGGAASLVAAVVGGLRPEWLAQGLLSLAAVAIAVGYFVLFWHTAGQTPGMRLMHVRVLSKRGDGRLTAWQAIVRTIGLALAIIPCFLGFVPALFDRRRRALPDYLAGTVVVYDDAGTRA